VPGLAPALKAARAHYSATHDGEALTQEQIAERVSAMVGYRVSNQTVSSWLSGQEPKLLEGAALCEILGIDARDVLERVLAYRVGRHPAVAPAAAAGREGLSHEA